jgi:hypothetical protein
MTIKEGEGKTFGLAKEDAMRKIAAESLRRRRPLSHSASVRTLQMGDVNTPWKVEVNRPFRR